VATDSIESPGWMTRRPLIDRLPDRPSRRTKRRGSGRTDVTCRSGASLVGTSRRYTGVQKTCHSHISSRVHDQVARVSEQRDASHMGVSLSKSGNVSLTEAAPDLTSIGWVWGGPSDRPRPTGSTRTPARSGWVRMGRSCRPALHLLQPETLAPSELSGTGVTTATVRAAETTRASRST
jgi:hypothetical protein